LVAIRIFADFRVVIRDALPLRHMRRKPTQTFAGSGGDPV